MNQKLRSLLLKCQKAGYTRISVGYRHESILQSISFPIGCSDSVFAWPCTKKQETDGWPAIWEIVEELKIGCGCGNSHQYQIIDIGETGVFHLINGKWVKVFPKDKKE